MLGDQPTNRNPEAEPGGASLYLDRQQAPLSRRPGAPAASADASGGRSSRQVRRSPAPDAHLRAPDRSGRDAGVGQLRTAESPQRAIHCSRSSKTRTPPGRPARPCWVRARWNRAVRAPQPPLASCRGSITHQPRPAGLLGYRDVRRGQVSEAAVGPGNADLPAPTAPAWTRLGTTWPSRPSSAPGSGRGGPRVGTCVHPRASASGGIELRRPGRCLEGHRGQLADAVTCSHRGDQLLVCRSGSG